LNIGYSVFVNTFVILAILLFRHEQKARAYRASPEAKTALANHSPGANFDAGRYVAWQ
jgi:hypothetical protein